MISFELRPLLQLVSCTGACSVSCTGSGLEMDPTRTASSSPPAAPPRSNPLHADSQGSWPVTHSVLESLLLAVSWTLIIAPFWCWLGLGCRPGAAISGMQVDRGWVSPRTHPWELPRGSMNELWWTESGAVSCVVCAACCSCLRRRRMSEKLANGAGSRCLSSRRQLQQAATNSSSTGTASAIARLALAESFHSFRCKCSVDAIAVNIVWSVTGTKSSL